MLLQAENTLEIHGRVLVATVFGEVDFHMAERFRPKLDAAFEKSSCRHILLDMSGVGFMDSSGIGMIIGRYKKAEMSGGRLVVAGMSERISRLFDISGLNKIITSVETPAAAMSLLGGSFNE